MIEQFMKKIELPTTEISMDGGKGKESPEKIEEQRNKEKATRRDGQGQEQRQAGEKIKPEESDLDQKQKEAK